MGGMPTRAVHLAIDAADPARLARFWSAALGWEVVASDATMYLWVAVPDAEALVERLLARGVLVAPGSFFGPSGEGYIRFALVPTLAECECAAAILAEL